MTHNRRITPFSARCSFPLGTHYTNEMVKNVISQTVIEFIFFFDKTRICFCRVKQWSQTEIGVIDAKRHQLTREQQEKKCLFKMLFQQNRFSNEFNACSCIEFAMNDDRLTKLFNIREFQIKHQIMTTPSIYAHYK